MNNRTRSWTKLAGTTVGTLLIAVVLLSGLVAFSCSRNGQQGDAGTDVANREVLRVPSSTTTGETGTKGEPAPPGSADADERNIRVTKPPEGARLSENPIIVAGEARTFENTVNVRVLDEDGEVIDTAVATAQGEMGNFNPFEAELYLTRWPGENLTIEALEHSAKDGSVRTLVSSRHSMEASRLPLQLFFSNSARSGNDCTAVYPVTREVPHTVRTARLVVEALIEGPARQEQREGYTTEISRRTTLQSVSIDGSEVTVDFGPEMSNVGGSCRVQAIRASLTESLLALPGIESVRITAMGNEDEALQP